MTTNPEFREQVIAGWIDSEWSNYPRDTEEQRRSVEGQAHVAGMLFDRIAPQVIERVIESIEADIAHRAWSDAEIIARARTRFANVSLSMDSETDHA